MLSRGVSMMGRQQPARGMATAQALRERISAVKNIKKITSAMKMVAVCKLRVAQENLEKSRGFMQTLEGVKFEVKNPPKPESKVWIGISSDRGLCGAINSSIARGVRDSMLKDQEAGMLAENQKIFLIGEKAKQGLERQFKENFETTISEVSKFQPCTFSQCAEITDFWTNCKVDSSALFFQHFKSMISYITTEKVAMSYDLIKDDLANEFAEFEVEGDSDALRNLHEFRNCVELYLCFAENETSTLSARMSAMDGSSKNAGEMIDSLQLVLNRSRQAKITTELSEIISGAAASDEQ
jgi:F-type H+-transporting ATPase subunit gamma